MGIEPRRLSLPPGAETRDLHRMTLSGVSSRRHTLIPSRSILKTTGEENNTISIPGDFLKARRRVSFAPEVTLHKINFAKTNEDRNGKFKRRSSLNGRNEDNSSKSLVQSQSKLSTSQYIGKVYNNDEKENLNSFSADVNDDNNLERAKQFIIDEDTQTMELSVELTQQILKQQEVINSQKSEVSIEDPSESNAQSLRDLFEEVDGDLDSPNEDLESESVEIELTESINKSLNHIGESEDVTMELTQPLHLDNGKIGPNKENHLVNEAKSTTEEKPIINETAKADLEFADVPETSFNSNLNEDLNYVEFELENETQTMELTQPVPSNLAKCSLDANDLEQNPTTIPVTVNSADPIFHSDDEAMELTESISHPIKPIQENLPAEKEGMDVAGTITKSGVEDGNLDIHKSGIVSENEGIISNMSPGEFSQSNFKDGKSFESSEENKGEPLQNAGTMNPPLHDEDEFEVSTDMETSLIGTEMVPLAEVTADYTENQEEYDSDDSFTNDDHINVSLDVFLNDVNVQFFDNIGPSDNEINRTLQFSPNGRTSLGSSSSTPTTLSTVSTPSTISTNTPAKANLIEFIEACTNIPYYHYIVHLINQYQSSIQSISTMVNTFSNDVLESNPTAIREFYQQIEDVKTDLSTNYQAIAIYTRKQAKCQNLRFMSGLLEQLLTSYERANERLEVDLSKALEWRRGILIERQKMIERKMVLDQYLMKLNNLRDNWNAINIEKMKKFNQQLKLKKEEKSLKSVDVNNLSSDLQLLEGSVSEKRIRRNKLLKEVEELRLQVAKRTVPNHNDLKNLTEKFDQLQVSKGIKLISSDPITLSISSLEVKFVSKNAEEFDVEISLRNLEDFRPFIELVKEFIRINTKSIKQQEINSFVKQLVQSWKVFKDLWQELLLLYFTHSGKIEGENFIIGFNLFKPITEVKVQKLSIEGNISELLDFEKDITVQVTWNGADENPDFDRSKVLDSLKAALGEEFKIMRRLSI